MVGSVYLLYFLTAVAAQFLTVRGLVVYGDVVNVIAYACYATVTLLFYHLFKPVDKAVSAIAACLSFVGCAIGALSIFDRNPFHANPLLFFGPYCVLIGYLILRSTFLPRILGALMLLAGVGWLLVLSPLAAGLTPYIEAIGILAEGSLMLWLLVVGV